jgi:hypothetical protein
MMDYAHIKTLAREQGCRVTDLIALAPQNDPFYVGTAGQQELGRWFAGLWQRFGCGAGVHLRRVHYQVISQELQVLMPNGKAIREHRQLLGPAEPGVEGGALPGPGGRGGL